MLNKRQNKGYEMKHKIIIFLVLVSSLIFAQTNEGLPQDMVKELDLTTKQVKQIRTHKRAHHKQMESINHSIEELHEDLDEEFLKEANDENKINQIINEIQQLHQNMINEHFNDVLQMRKILTVEKFKMLVLQRQSDRDSQLLEGKPSHRPMGSPPMGGPGGPPPPRR